MKLINKYNLLLVVAAQLLSACATHSEVQDNAPVARADTDTMLTIAAVGDIMMDGTARPEFRKFGYDYPFVHVGKYLSRADIALGNLEGPLTTGGSVDVEKKYVFRSPPDKVAAALAKGIRAHGDPLPPPACLVWGGETTVKLPDAPGRGGRNQHLALAAATLLTGRDDVGLLAIGTDGSDGPTEDAGALVDGGTLARGELNGLDAAEHLLRADSGTFLEASGDLISTGPTGTNVRDLVIAWKG